MRVERLQVEGETWLRAADVVVVVLIASETAGELVDAVDFGQRLAKELAGLIAD